MKEKLPILIRTSVAQTKFDPDAVDAEIFVANTTEDIFSFSTKSESFTTLDEETGITSTHGSTPGIFTLAPNESIQIADVKGWEWDGHVGIELCFRKKGSETIIRKSYNLKTSISDFIIPDNGKTGRLIPPTK